MTKRKHIDEILQSWEFDPDAISVRIVRGDDERQLIQMRIDLGLLQLEVEGRPDGATPGGYATYLDYLRSIAIQEDGGLELDDEQCNHIDREFVQFFHRRICWLELRRFEMAVEDADHTLALMDFCREYSTDEQWVMAHEQYRPFVLFHRTQAAALCELEAEGEPAEAIERINEGLSRIKDVFETYEVEDQYESDELVQRLTEMREDLRRQFQLGQTLREKLADAIAKEQYELAARIRDEMAKRNGPAV